MDTLLYPGRDSWWRWQDGNPMLSSLFNIAHMHNQSFNTKHRFPVSAQAPPNATHSNFAVQVQQNRL